MITMKNGAGVSSLEAGALKVARQERAVSCQFSDVFRALSFSLSPFFLPFVQLQPSQLFIQLFTRRVHLFNSLFIDTAICSATRLIQSQSIRAVSYSNRNGVAGINFLHGGCYFGKPLAKIDTRRCARLPGSINRGRNFELIAPSRIRADLRLTNFLALFKLTSRAIYNTWGERETFLRLAYGECTTEADPLFPVRKEASGLSS